MAEVGRAEEEPVALERIGVVRLQLADTGEVKEWAMAGVDPPGPRDLGEGWPWRLDSLELALNLVPSLMEAIDRGRLRGRCIEVKVTDGNEADRV